MSRSNVPGLLAPLLASMLAGIAVGACGRSSFFVGPEAPGSSESAAATVTTLAGNGIYGYADGPSGSTEFRFPTGVAVDPRGNVLVADSYNNRIREVAPDGTTSTLAGNGIGGLADGTGGVFGTAEFSDPTGVAVDSDGEIYVADFSNSAVREVSPGGTVTTLACTLDSSLCQMNEDSFYRPASIAIRGTQVVISSNESLQLIDPSGNVSRLAGSTYSGTTDGPAGSAQFNDPFGLATDAFQNIYVADNGNGRLRKLDPAGDVTTIAGTVDCGYENGPADSAQLCGPFGIAVDATGTVYFSDFGNNRIRLLAPAGFVSTLAGDGLAGFEDGNGDAAEFNGPAGIAVDGSGAVYVADQANNRIRKISR